MRGWPFAAHPPHVMVAAFGCHHHVGDLCWFQNDMACLIMPTCWGLLVSKRALSHHPFIICHPSASIGEGGLSCARDASQTIDYSMIDSLTHHNEIGPMSLVVGGSLLRQILQIDEIRAPSLMADWNESHSVLERAMVGDIISFVNGSAGDGISMLEIAQAIDNDSLIHFVLG